MVVRLVIGLLMTVVVVAFVGRRAWTIYTLIRSGQPAPDRSQDLGRAVAHAAGGGVRADSGC